MFYYFLVFDLKVLYVYVFFLRFMQVLCEQDQIIFLEDE